MKTIMEQDSNVDGESVPAGTSAATPVRGRRAPIHRDPPLWLRRQSQLLMVLDGAAAVVATLASQVWSFGWRGTSLEIHSVQIPYTAAVLVTVPVWLVILAVHRCNDIGPFGAVNNEVKRVIGAGANFLAVIAVIYYAVRLERLAREYLIVIVPLAVGLTLLGRLAARYQLRIQRERGHATRRAIIMGPRRTAHAVLERLAQHPHSGIVVTAALTNGNGHDTAITRGEPAPLLGGAGELGEANVPEAMVPILGRPNDLFEALPTSDADLLIITGGLAPGELRKLTWELEETGVEVLVAPAAANVAEPQLDIRPVAGLPLLYVDHTAYLPPKVGL